MTGHNRIAKIKIMIPSAAGPVLKRERLDGQLAASLAHRLTLVSAPAGYGKTTLVADWARGAAPLHLPVWVSVDEADRGGIRLLRHIVAALRCHHPGFGGDMLALLDGSHAVDPRDLLNYLLDDLASWGVPVVVVLDDFHRAAGRLLHRALDMAVRRLPACVRLVLVTRQLPALPLASWRARGWLGEIGPAQLAFQPLEVQAFLAECMGLPASNDVACALHASTQGWVAGLQIAALSVRYDDAANSNMSLLEQVGSFSGRHRYAADFMAGDVLAPLAPPLQHFLRDCAVLDRMNPSLCETVTLRADAASLVAQLERAHLLVATDACATAWRHCPKLLREALLARLAPEDARALHVRAAMWYERQGQPVPALEHALAAQDFEVSVRLLCRTLDHSLHHGEVYAILARLDALPESVLMGHLDLVGCKAWLLCLVGRSAEAREYADLAVRHCAVPGTGSGVLNVFCAYYELNWGDAARAIEAARTAVGHLRPEDVSLRIMVGSFLGQALVMTGRPDEAITAWRETLQVGQRVRPAKALDVLFHLVPLLQAQGQLREARVLCEQALAQHRDAAGTPLPLAGPAHVAMALVLHDIGELPQARATAERALVLCRTLGVVYYELHAQRALARILWALDEHELAWRALAEGRERLLAAHSPRRAGIVELLAAELHLAAGQLQPALRALGHPSIASFSAQDDRVVLLRARAMLHQHRPQEALQLLERQEVLARKLGFDGSRIAIAVLQARCWQRIGNKPAERRSLERALVQASFSGARSALMEDGAPLLSTLAELRGVAPAFAATLALPAPPPAEQPDGAAAVVVPLDPLTPRDVEVLVLLKRGLRNQEIADQLTITIGTTKQYVNRLFAKLGVRNRVEAVSLGRRLQLLR